nr:NADPH oxidase [Eriocheir sinensis]
MEVLASSGMVLRDKNSSPKLIFDNATHTKQNSSGPPSHLEVKKDLRGTRSFSMKGNASRVVERRLSLSGDVLKMFKGKGRPASTKISPEVDLEDHIIENIRNRGFWAARSVRRISSLRVARNAGSTVPLSSTRTAPALPSKGPFLFPEAPGAAASDHGSDAGEGEGDGGEDQAAIDSAMMMEVQQEARLRDNISWMRQYLTQVSEADGGSFTQAAFHSALSNKELLRRLFSLWDVEGEGALPQLEWIDFLKCSAENSSAKEVGAREWVELLEVLAYVVCGEEGEVTEEVFTTILTSRGVLEKLYRLINKDADGVVTKHEIMDFIANLTYARPRTGFTRENLEWLEQMFRQALGHKQELSFDDFKKIVHSRNSFFAERVFQIFDRDNSGTVSLSEFLDAMHQFAGKSPNDKIKFLFRVYDLDGDGLIQQSELQKVMKACMEENGMRFSDEQIQDLTLAMFEDADTQNTGAITYESLKAQLEKHDGLIENLSISIDRWLVPPNLGKEKGPVVKKMRLTPYQMSLPYLKNNYVYLSFLLAYIAINLGLFISRAIEYKDHNGLTILARACGQCLNFNCMFVCVLVLRQSITYLRSMGGASFLPLDQHLYLHKLCGILIFVYSVLHTIAHLINFGVFIQPLTGPEEPNKNNCTYAELIFTLCPELFGLYEGIANPTGVALMIILTVMVVCSLPFVRKSGYFEVFYWTHLLYIAFWTLCILHGPNFWKWFVAPGIIFLIERVHRSIRMRTGRGKTYISSGVLLPSKVIHLVIKRPPTFQYHPGDYVFINIPQIANYEWHPFTISSAPEQDDVLWLHIRAVGQWTRRLYDYFESEQKKCDMQHEQGGKALHAALTLQDGSMAFNTLFADGRTGAYLTAPSTTIQAPGSGKNGVTNLAYDHDTKQGRVAGGEGGVTEGQEDAPVAATRRKRRINKENSEAEVTKSNGGADGELEASLPSPEGGEEAGQRLTEEDSSNALYLRPRLTQATSFKYMRRKPRVITLDLPSETESIDEDTEDSEEMERDSEGQYEKHSKDLQLTKQDPMTMKTRDLAVAEEGRARRKSQVERKKSRQEDRKMRKLSRLEEALVEGGCAVMGKPLVVYMDGPFGAPSSHIFRAQHAVLIATGIGVTPFASILQSIMHKYWKARHTCPRCTHTWTSDLPQSVMNLRKVDFFWINRDQRSFEWFVNLLSQLEIEQAEQGGVLERFLDMHMYITSALQKTDMKAVGLQLALDLLHEKEKRDLITGLKTRTNAGRPNWDKVFKQLTNQQKGKITVFYCGPPALGRTLRYRCDEYGLELRKEIF